MNLMMVDLKKSSRSIDLNWSSLPVLFQVDLVQFIHFKFQTESVTLEGATHC